MRQHIIVFLACTLTLLALLLGVRANITNCNGVDGANIYDQSIELRDLEIVTRITNNTCPFFGSVVAYTGLPIYGYLNVTHNISIAFYYTVFSDSSLSLNGDMPDNFTLLLYNTYLNMSKTKYAVIMNDVRLHNDVQLVFVHTNAVWLDATTAGVMVQASNLIMGARANFICSNATQKNAKAMYNFSGSGPLYLLNENALIFSINDVENVTKPLINIEQELVMSNRSTLIMNKINANIALHIRKLTMHNHSALVMSNIVAEEVVVIDNESTAAEDTVLMMHNISSYNPITLPSGGGLRFTLEAVNVSVADKPVDLQYPEDYLPMLDGFHVEEIRKDGTYANNTCSMVQCIDSNYVTNDDKPCQCPCGDGLQGPTCIRLNDRTQSYMTDLTRPCTVAFCAQCRDAQVYRCGRCNDGYSLEDNTCFADGQ